MSAEPTPPLLEDEHVGPEPGDELFCSAAAVSPQSDYHLAVVDQSPRPLRAGVGEAGGGSAQREDSWPRDSLKRPGAQSAAASSPNYGAKPADLFRDDTGEQALDAHAQN